MRDWTFRGTALDEIGVVTLVSNSLKLPHRRGDNTTIPFRDGRVFHEKMFEQRALTLGLEIITDSVGELEQKVDTLKALVGQRSLGALSVTMDDDSVRQALAELTGDLPGGRTSAQWLKLTLDFTMPDPFFRADTLTSEVIGIDESPKVVAITNPGTADQRNPKITLTGPLENTKITNTENSVSVKYNGAIGDGDTVIIDVDAETGEYTAEHSIDGNVIGNVTHEGSAALLVLITGENDLSITDDEASTGSVTIEFYAPYL